MPDEHFLHIYFGDGKGKTTSCIGLAIRAVGSGRRVWMIQFDKGYDGTYEHYSERKVLRSLPGLRLDPTGCERLRPGEKFRFGVTEEDKAEAQRAMALARDAVTSEDYDLVILDEALSAQQYHLISEGELMDLITLWKRERKNELVLSGRTKLQSVIGEADLVTEMRKVKHYFDQGVIAREGIEY
jgi:cob(I)alamin adenosyltransferase